MNRILHWVCVLGQRIPSVTRGGIICALLHFGANSMQAQVTDPIQKRLQDVCTLISGTLSTMEDVFSTDFLATVPPSQLRMGVAQITSATGACTSITITSRQGEHTVFADAVTENGYSIPVTMSIEEKAPHRIVGLFLKPPVKIAENFDAILRDLSKLNGKTSICIVDLDSGRVVLQRDTSSYLPIGSAFKLYILGELERSIAAGEHRWDEVTKLDARYYSPSGALHDWPVGAPITLHTLAAAMISTSDNTATDHLLFLLGRERVEAIQFAMGHSKPPANIPFMSTMEMFRLKFRRSGQEARRYVVQDERGKRQMLTSLATIPEDSLMEAATPVLPDSVEWFATTADLCRAMQYLYNGKRGTSERQTQEILAINRGISIDSRTWPTVGYKGGSEPGVMNMTYYLQREDGRRFALSATWMRRDADVDQDAFAALVGGTIRMLSGAR